MARGPSEGRAVAAGGQPPAGAPTGLAMAYRLEAGDPAAPFILPDLSGTQWSPLDNDIAGKPLLLLFDTAGSPADFFASLTPFLAAKDELHRLGCGLFALTRAELRDAASLWRDGKPILPLLLDRDGKVFRNYRIDGVAGSDPPGAPAVAVLLNANMKVVYASDGAAPPDPRRIADELAQMRRSRLPLSLAAHPPVLIVPSALSAADCGALIEEWRGLDRRHGAAGHSQVDPGCVKFLREYGQLRQYLIEDARLQQALDAKLARRLMPEISKAFDTRAPQREAYALSCYDAADGGTLHPHRDCASQETRHRRFTVSVALNESFQGGALRFREYGEQTYRLPIGAAIIFSCALLHEVLPVSVGRRFVLVTHLHGQ